MNREFVNYQKKHDFLLCLDSDGTAMNTMEAKHQKCFGPAFVEEWGLEKYRHRVLDLWNNINLYSELRGVNRFQGLYVTLAYVNANITLVGDLEPLKRWLDCTERCSNAALIRYMEDDDSPILQKVLHWSQKASELILTMPISERCPFAGVEETLSYASEFCDIVVVSSANSDAVFEEWEHYGLSYYTSLLLSQNAGSKEYCISQFLDMGYEKDRVLMVGDGLDDLEAARNQGVLFYPITIRRETECWDRLQNFALDNFLDGGYAGDYAEKLIYEMESALSSDYET
ncbi:MAG: HAD family hydrolase [Lachnospiraceae bacterium]|nr:HAD family hydrolase [Lachnospiraceae bacterium]